MKKYRKKVFLNVDDNGDYDKIFIIQKRVLFFWIDIKMFFDLFDEKSAEKEADEYLRKIIE